MGRAAKEVKDRVCHTCREVLSVSAKDLKRHARLCEQAKDIRDRMEAIGLVNPNLEIRHG